MMTDFEKERLYEADRIIASALHRLAAPSGSAGDVWREMVKVYYTKYVLSKPPVVDVDMPHG